ncbi:hypothetical protein L7F22_013411 [Adiantum nelumboides]|nr:hypothetical protein [Adiantum nelumboides]
MTLNKQKTVTRSLECGILSSDDEARPFKQCIRSSLLDAEQQRPASSSFTFIKAHDLDDVADINLQLHPSSTTPRCDPCLDTGATRCTPLAKLIDSGIVAENDPVFYRRKKDKVFLKQTRNGVLCCCCGKLFLLASFEVHAGSGHKRPCANMFLEDGRSLEQCQKSAYVPLLKLPKRAQKQKPSLPHSSGILSSRIGESTAMQFEDEIDGDDICAICGDGGQLMLCDNCPSAFHPTCLNLEKVPNGEWHCSRCQCHKCGLGEYDGDADRRMISCTECCIPYHTGCVMQQYSDGFENKGHWFCTSSCHNVFKRLQQLVGREFLLGSGLRWMLLRSVSESKVEKDIIKIRSEKKLSQAMKLFEECFDPIVDYQTNIDLLSQMVYCRKSHVRRLDCRSFYTIVLLRGEQLVSAATVRTHGSLLAEMPLIGMGHRFRNLGMCKALMQALQAVLRHIGISKLILPSVNDLIPSWRDSFGFEFMSPQDHEQILQTNVLTFPGTSLLYKRVDKINDEGSHISSREVKDHLG